MKQKWGGGGGGYHMLIVKSRAQSSWCCGLVFACGTVEMLGNIQSEGKETCYMICNTVYISQMSKKIIKLIV